MVSSSIKWQYFPFIVEKEIKKAVNEVMRHEFTTFCPKLEEILHGTTSVVAEIRESQ